MTRQVLALVGAAAIGAVIGLVLTRDPSEPLAVLAVVGSAAIAVACYTALLAMGLEGRWSPARTRRAGPHLGRALRRGIEMGAFVAALGLLRAADGLTVITAGFVLAGLALAELVLSTRPATRS